VYQRREPRQFMTDLRPVIASDLEGTLTNGETWRGVRAYLESHGRKADYSRFMRAKIPLYLGAKLGVVPKRYFQNRWIEDLPALFTGMTPDDFQLEVAAWVVQHELLPKARRNVIAELEAAQKAGARVILASGTYQPVLESFAAEFGFETVGTSLEVRDGALTGRLKGPINVAAHKIANLRQHLGNAALNRAYGDTLPDLPMLEAAQEAVVVTGNDRKLEIIAKARGWRVLG
jgi:HAD superfamily phosphoserine phosphatase-like hydrolase